MVSIEEILNFQLYEISGDPVIPITVQNVLFAIITIIIGYIVSIIVSKYIKHVMKKGKLGEILAEFASRVLKIFIIIFAISIAIGYFGIDVGAAVVSISVVGGFIFGFAFQETLGNLAAGFMIAITKPFRAGDYVDVAGKSGSIKSVGTSITKMTTIDNKRIIIPNSKVWGEPITNYTALKTRMIDMRVGISYGDDIGKAIKIAMDVLKKHDKVLDDPVSYVGVAELGDSSVNLLVRPWVKTSDYWNAKWQITQQIKESFDKNGISIPFPQRDVHLFEHKK